MHDQVAPPRRVLGRRESLALNALRRRRPDHLLRQVQRDLLLAQQRRDFDPRAAQRLKWRWKFLKGKKPPRRSEVDKEFNEESNNSRAESQSGVGLFRSPSRPGPHVHSARTLAGQPKIGFWRRGGGGEKNKYEIPL